MDEQFILDLLLRYEQGRCTEEEIQLLDEWYRHLGKSVPVPPLADHERKTLEGRIWEGVAGKIEKSVSPGSLRAGYFRRHRAIYVSAAAAVVIFLFLFCYRWRTTATADVYVTVMTRQGELKKVGLPDQSVVWLNGGSRLRYPADMHSYRRLFLDEGEAFFDVHPDHDHPFTVRTANGLQIKVLGTAFAIKAYESIADEKVVVLRGRVVVENNGRQLAVLTKGQGAQVNKRKGTQTPLRVDSAEVNGWTYGKVSLNNVSFEELSVALQNSFATRILFLDGSLNDKRVSISFTSKDSLNEILNALKTIYRISYDKDEKSRTVRIRAGR